jgi:hypothetical protein
LLLRIGIRTNDQLLANANHVAAHAVPFSDLCHSHAVSLCDGDQSVPWLHHDSRRVSLHAVRRQRGKAQKCDPEDSEHADSVYRILLSQPKKKEKTHYVALLRMPDTLIG